METVRHWKRRWAYSRFSSSMPSSVRLYVSSRLFGKSSKTLRMPTGKQRRNLSIWHTTHRNLCDHVSVCCEAPHNVTENLHAVCTSREHVNNQSPVLLSPTPHLPV